MDERDFSQYLALSLEVEDLKREYDEQKVKYLNEQGATTADESQLVKRQVSQMELLRKVIREKEQKLFILRFKSRK